VLIERTLIDVVNRHYGRPVVDAIGRHVEFIGGSPLVAHADGGGPADHPGRRFRPAKK
jgi:hypothetical protein